MMKNATIFLLVCFTGAVGLAAQTTQSPDSVHADSTAQSKPGNPSIIPPEQTIIQLIDVKDTSIKDVARMIATKYNLNIFVDNAVDTRITLRLSNIPAKTALQFIAEENGLLLEQNNHVFKLRQPKEKLPEPTPIEIRYENDLLYIDVQEEPIAKVVRAISEATGKSIILNRGVEGTISGFIHNTGFENGLKTLLASQGFMFQKQGDVYVVDRYDLGDSDSTTRRSRSFWVEVNDGLITLDVSQGDLNQIIQEIASQIGVDIFFYGTTKGSITAHCKALTFDQILDFLFKGTEYTYRHENGIYFIGDKTISGISSIKLVQLKHLKVEGIIALLPESITKNATLQEIKEQNGLMISGPQSVIRELEGLIQEIDRPIAQILFEVLVVDFNTSDVGEFGITAGYGGGADSNFVGSHFPDISINADSKALNKSLQFYAPKLGIQSIGKLPTDFFLKIRAMDQEGKANIRSQPQIATLNGHPASINIGTTQYYILESQQPLVGGNQVINQVSQRFEKITAEIGLFITPWVSATGEITAEISQEFTTPKGSLSSQLPPTLDHRSLESTVKLHDGETIVLGGLIQTTENETIDKYPVLGSIPLLGRVFQNRSHNKNKSELIIYITPHLYYHESQDIGSGVIE